MANLNEALHTLRREYVAEANENLGHIDRLISKMQTEPSGPTLEHLYRRFLGLAGSGDTYGFPEVSRLGRQGEKLCGALLRTGRFASPSVLLACRAVLRSLQAEFDRLRPLYLIGPWVQPDTRRSRAPFLRWGTIP
jgi:hypothetical protein